MMHISFEIVIIVQAFKLLHFRNGAQSSGSYDLRHTSCENAASVHSRQNAVFAPDVTYFIGFSAVGTYSLVEYTRSHLFLCHLVKHVVYERKSFGVSLSKMLLCGCVYLVLVFLSLSSVEGIQRFCQHIVSKITNFVLLVLRNGMQVGDDFGFAHLGNDKFYKIALLFDFLVTEHNSFQHLLFAYLVCSRLHHHYGVLRARKIERKLSSVSLRGVGIDYQLAVDQSDDDAARRSRKGYV